MTYTYTFDNMIILQQIGSAYIDNDTSVEMLRLNEEGWNCDAIHNYPQGDRCYVILSKHTKISPEGAKDIYDALSDLYDESWHMPLPNSSAIWYALHELAKYLPEPEPQEEILAQWNIAFPYAIELWD